MAYTTINKPTEHFNTKLYTGNGGTQTISGIGFQPDFTWVKSRNYAYYHYLQDAVRGSSNVLYTNNNDAEATGVTAGISAWNSDGYVTGSQGALNGNGKTFVAWNWKANGTGSANTVGSINSTVSANTTSGFSIVSYTGNGGSTPKTVGHGLGVAPKMIIIKPRNLTYDWMTYNENVGATKGMCLNTTQAPFTSSNFNDTAPTTSVFSVKNNATNETNGNYIAYCFAEKQGFSKFSSYIGNGNNDGTFVYTGFKPAFVLVKRTDAVANWSLIDNTRDPFNVTYHFLEPNVSDVEFTPSGPQAAFDFCSQGFKCRSTNGAINASGGTYIYMAFAEAPLVGSNNVPCTAR